ncbi:sensor histidine kinase [uncultured Clostridium sp.]|uniref:sensor histidine kinase n=1 Tax=uncultured Clostridium sp. TaxID=59620 RepID=UPI0028EE0DDF|nr:sensor histidine kinase [uncultured Clostridium sp.]
MSDMNNRIQSKNGIKIYGKNIISFLIFIIMSIGIFSIYPKIEELTREEPSVPYENHELLEDIYRSNYVLYKDIINQQNGEEQTGDEIYIGATDKAYTNDINVIRNFNYELNSWKDDLNNGLRNLDYLVYLNDTSQNKTNTNNDLNLLVSDANDSNLKDKYAWYMIIKYDQNGVISINNVYGADENTIKNTFSSFNLRDIWGYNIGGDKNIKINPIKNATFVYAISKDLKYSDNISVIVDNSLNKVNTSVFHKIITIILFCALILGLLIPYKRGNDILGINVFFKIPCEINCIIFGFGALFSVLISPEVILETLKGRLAKDMMGQYITANIANPTAIVVNIIIWTLILYLIFAGDMLLKYIFNTGIVKYLNEKLLVIKIFKLLKKFTDSIIDYVEHIDLTDKSNKVIIKVLLINFVILSIISIVWFFGIVASIMYSIVLFIMLRKYVDNIRMKFKILLKATNQIADGNLDVEINEDLGLFNPFKEQIKIIQKGFKRAVDEEVKSQKMKTELISNVSHDLKTPLTSIITYVDLLKNENISEEERRSYIDTIDKKSQRLKFLIEDLFEVSKATSGDIKLNLVNVDIVELMKQTQIELEDKIRNSDLKIKNNFPSSKIILKLDGQKTFRIFENLLNNITKYAMKGSRVYVDIVENDGNVEIVMRNMSAEEITFNAFDIAERFQRGDKSRNTEGSGLGLAIAKSFIEVQGGRFDIDIDGDLFKVIIQFRK